MKILKRPLNFQNPCLSNTCISIQRAIQSLYNNPNTLNIHDYGHLIQFCTNQRLISQAKQLHARLILFNFTLDNFLGSKLINFYSSIGHISYARKVFDKIPQRNAWSYNAMLVAYSFHEHPMETLKLYSSFVKGTAVLGKPDNFSLTCVLKAYSSLFSNTTLAKEVHCHVLRHGFDSDLFVANALITCYMRCDEMGLARKVFDLMEKRDIVSWNSMISGYSHGGCYQDCLKLYKLMLDSNSLKPDGVTIVSVLQACAQAKDLVHGMEVHRFVIENNIRMDIAVSNAVIGLYARCDRLDYAKELFDEMNEKDEVTYGCLISGYLAHGYVDRALDLFRGMQSPNLSTWNSLIAGLVQNNICEASLSLMREMQASGFRPNSVTLSSILSALSYFFDLKGGKQVHSYAIRNGFDGCVYVTTGIIDVYGKAGFLQGVSHVFDRSRQRNVIIWTVTIAAYASYGDANHALHLFDDMLNYGTEPDPVTFVAVLTACARLGDTDKAWKILEDMQQKYGIQPVAEHYYCIIRVLSRTGNLDKATEFMSKVPIEPTPGLCDALLNDTLIQGDVDLGKLVSEYLSGTKPEIIENTTG